MRELHPKAIWEAGGWLRRISLPFGPGRVTESARARAHKAFINAPWRRWESPLGPGVGGMQAGAERR